jgi:hypothetical protein
MEKMVEEGALEYFLQARISYENLERMFNIIWEHKSLGGRMEDAEEHIVREELIRLIDAIDDEDEAFEIAPAAEREITPEISK